MERYMELTQYLLTRLMEKPDCFQVIVPEPECTNVCFWYVPCRFRGMAPGPERDRLLGQVHSFNTTNTVKIEYTYTLTDHTNIEGQDDDYWHSHGRLPAPRKAAQLLQMHHIKSSRHRG